MRVLWVAMLLAAAPVLAAEPLAGIEAAVAASDRPAAARALDAGRRPAEVLKFLGLRPGDHVLDVMTGNGYYAELMGHAVGSSGTVRAQESPVFIDAAWRERFAALVLRVPNVKALEVMPGDLQPAPNSLDFTLMHLVYHDLYWSSDKYRVPRIDPAVVLKRIYAATRPGGIVGVVDHVATPGGEVREVVGRLHRIDPATIKADFKAAGFVLEAESDLLRMSADPRTESGYDGPTIKGKTDRAVLRFRKPATGAR